MSVVVRPMIDADDLAVFDVDNPDAWIAHWWRGADRDQDPPHILWFVGELDGDAVGFGAALRQPAGFGGYGVGIVRVVPHSRRLGVGTALLGAVEQTVRDAGLPGLLLSRVEGEPDGRAAAAAWGLQETGRHRENVLDLSAIDRAAFRARAAVPGVELHPLPPMSQLADEQWNRFYEFLAARLVESPDVADGGEAPPSAVVRNMITDPWSVITAEEGGSLVAVTVVSRRPGAEGIVDTFFTGTAPHARGRGIVTALKCEQALLLAAAGITRISTQNMDGNLPILAANRTLGYVESGGHVDVVRTF